MASEDLNACAGVVEKSDPDRFLAIMAATAAERAVLFPLFAFNAEVARAPWMTQEPLIAEMRLQWWRDVLNDIGQGKDVRRHEVMTPLAEVLDSEGARLLDGVIEARRWDIQSEPFQDDEAFKGHIDATSGNLLWAGARALGAESEAVVRDLAYAAGLAGWFRAIPELEARGRMPLPDGRTDAVRALAQEGLQRLAQARAQRRKAKAAVSILRTGWQAEVILRQVAAEPGRVAAGSLGQSEFSRKGSLLLKSMTGRW